MNGIKWLKRLSPRNTALKTCLFLFSVLEMNAIAKLAKATE
jgi:hypothetical protein